MQEKICLKRTGNTGHFMESERNLYEYSNSFRHHTSGICTTGSEYLRYGLSHHWIKSAIPHRTLKNIQLTTSHRGRHHSLMGVVFAICISTHYLTQRQTGSPLKFCLNCIFQLTTSHRGRQTVKFCFSGSAIFQLTTSHRGRHLFPVISSVKDLFQLTTSHRGRRSEAALEASEEIISTHYLTQRQTAIRNTKKQPHTDFNSLPHTEVDNISGTTSGNYIVFQLTTSHRDRLNVISIGDNLESFQLTTSHRGRPLYFSSSSLSQYFNSLPHTEVDTYSLASLYDCEYFNSLPHTEVD